jgi:ubiquinone/menaquinone biosynthesis C-methylase UbiE
VTHRLPFRDRSFDGILAKDIIEHLESPQDLIREAGRVSQTGAILVLTTPRAVPRAVWADYTHIRGFTRSALASLLTDSGWTNVSIRRHGAVPLMGRLNLVKHIPTLLSIPVVGHRFGTNWIVVANRV